jgi:ribonuclease R
MSGGTAAHFPTRSQIQDFITDSKVPVGKREIARAFDLSGQDKIALKALLKEMEEDGTLTRSHGRNFENPGAIAKVAVLKIVHVSSDGDLFAIPEADEKNESSPRIRIIERRGAGREGGARRSALGLGDRVLARIEKSGENKYRAHPLKQLERAVEPVLGILRQFGTPGENLQYRLEPVDKKMRTEFTLTRDDLSDAIPGELVLCEIKGRTSRKGLGLQSVRVIERLGNPSLPKSVSLIAIHNYGLPTVFSEEALAEAKKVSTSPLGDREDLRNVPLITIDPSDARDHDDAIYAVADPDPENAGGWQIIVAIADVSFYVRPGSALDADAQTRGNSTYFPDRVVPMLPEILSADICSLMPDVDRACMACFMTINASGKMLNFRFSRSVMRSHANLAYEKAQAAMDGNPDAQTAPLLDTVLKPLWGAWGALKKARDGRGPLNLELPERRVQLNDAGVVTGIQLREHLDAHQVVEDYMIAANVAAALQLEKKNTPCVYRAHEVPSAEKLLSLKEFLASVDIKLTLGQVIKPALFNALTAKMKDSDMFTAIQDMVLRSQAQAIYTSQHIGHFGLALTSYAHFTSPIRRYADLIVHRGLTRALKLGDGGLVENTSKDLEKVCAHISSTERRSMMAERETIDRYVAGYLTQHIGETLPGRITSVTKFGLFVTVEGIGGDGLIPAAHLGAEYFRFDEKRLVLEGGTTGITYRLGQRLPIRLVEANPSSGGMRFELVDADGQSLSRPRMARGGPPKGGSRFKRRR